MAYQFEHDESVQQGLRRIALERIEKAVEVIEAARGDASRGELNDAVHEARKRCKELRALVRLVRPCFGRKGGGYDRENAAFRDAARLLADLRDAQTLVETLDDLLAGDETDADRFASIRAHLAEHRAEQAGDAQERLAGFVKQMRRAGERAGSWTLDERGAKALRGGLEQTYERCRDAMALAREAPTTEHLHDWRKRVKYNRYHLRLLRGVWKPVVEPVRKQARRLSDLLGDEHDLGVLDAAVRAADVDAALLDELLGRIERRRQALRDKAFPLGARLYAQKPGHYGRHAAELWRLRRGS